MLVRKKTTCSIEGPALKRVSDYARSVLSGAEVAGPHVRNACRRHFDDLERGHERGLYFDDDAALRVFRFFEERLKLSEGQFEGRPFKLHPSQAFKLGSLFGWMRADGSRRFRRAYVEEGKGNGKSPFAGGVGLYGLIADQEPGAQIYAAGAKKEQAGILFQDACKMVRAAPALNERLKFSGGMGREFNIAHHKSQSFFRPISKDSGKSGSGPRPHFALCDEVHEHPDRSTMEMLERGFKFRRQPLLLMITNSGSDRNSICWEEHEHAVKVAAGTLAPDEAFSYVGEVIDDTTFAWVCALDKDDDPLEDPTCWKKANPLLGTILTREYLGAFIFSDVLRGLGSLSEAATRIDNSLKVAGLSGAELERVYEGLSRAALANGAPIETLASLYSKAAQAQKELGVTSEELLGFTNNVALALRVAGTDAQAASGALLQLGQALGSGKVQAEEFNSILEGAPTIAQAAAAGLKEAGGSVSQLKQLVVDGAISSEAFFRAFEAGSAILEEKAARSTQTIGQATNNLYTALTNVTREFNSSTGASENFAQGINSAASAINGFDVSGLIQKIREAKNEFDGFLASLGNAQVFKDLNDLLGTTDGAGNVMNLDKEQAEDDVNALEREVQTLLRSGKSAAEALANALDKVVDKLIDVALNSVFGTGGGSGGGNLGGLFGGIFGFAKGGIAARGRPQPLKKFARGGVSRSAAIFGEAGPEAAVPLPDGRSIPVKFQAPAIPRSSQSGGGNQQIHVTVGVSADSNGNLLPFVESVSQKTVTAASPKIVSAANQQAPAAVAKYQQQKAGGEWR